MQHDTWLNMGTAFHKKKDFNKAIEYFNKAIGYAKTIKGYYKLG